MEPGVAAASISPAHLREARSLFSSRALTGFQPFSSCSRYILLAGRPGAAGFISPTFWAPPTQNVLCFGLPMPTSWVPTRLVSPVAALVLTSVVCLFPCDTHLGRQVELCSSLRERAGTCRESTHSCAVEAGLRRSAEAVDRVVATDVYLRTVLLQAGKSNQWCA